MLYMAKFAFAINFGYHFSQMLWQWRKYGISVAIFPLIMALISLVGWVCIQLAQSS